MNKLVILSDIHGNLSALQAVIQDFQSKYSPEAIVLLGDLIDYGMRSNEVIELIQNLEKKYPIFCNIQGNHEATAMSPENHLNKFSSERGKTSILYTIKHLSRESFSYIKNCMENEGKKVLELNDNKILCVHGDLTSPFWGKMSYEEMLCPEYSVFDYVFSGHSHIPHLTDIFYEINNPSTRNKKKTTFINPGSVGQPRNHNPFVQYVYLDLFTETIHYNAVSYDIDTEQKFFTQEIDLFYKNRIRLGI